MRILVITGHSAPIKAFKNNLHFFEQKCDVMMIFHALTSYQTIKTQLHVHTHMQYPAGGVSFQDADAECELCLEKKVLSTKLMHFDSFDDENSLMVTVRELLSFSSGQSCEWVV